MSNHDHPKVVSFLSSFFMQRNIYVKCPYLKKAINQSLIEQTYDKWSMNVFSHLDKETTCTPSMSCALPLENLVTSFSTSSLVKKPICGWPLGGISIMPSIIILWHRKTKHPASYHLTALLVFSITFSKSF
ncbi:hypothetical protein O6H91_Y481800 [Diphasiastrum complanatum]|nr:hypothetical protein O6H91_Y481800 [Diphasiastrum complanatum]